MNSIEFGKKCRPYNIQYRDIFGYVPCRDDYTCSQDEYFDALLKAIETKCELSTIMPKKNKDFQLNLEQESPDNVRQRNATLIWYVCI